MMQKVLQHLQKLQKKQLLKYLKFKYLKSNPENILRIFYYITVELTGIYVCGDWGYPVGKTEISWLQS